MLFILNNVDIASYENDNTRCVVASDVNGVITSSEKSFKALFEWFQNKLSKSNADKCYLLASSSGNTSIRVVEYDVRKSKCEKLLGIKFDSKLTF